MLDVEGGVDVDPGVEQFEHVLPALGVAGAGGVGVGELVDQHELRPAADDGLQVHFREMRAAVVDGFARHEVQAGEQRLGFDASVGFDHADDQIGAAGALLLPGPEHGVGLADPRAHAEEDLQVGALRPGLLLLQRGEQRIGIGT